MVSINEKAEKIQQLADLQQQIAALAERTRASSDTAESDRKALFTLIRQARGRGVRPSDLADLTGYTRQRIWQICDAPEEEIA